MGPATLACLVFVNSRAPPVPCPFQLVDIEPMVVAAYVEYLGTLYAKPSGKQALYGIRIDAEHFFAVRVVDWSKAKQRAANVAANNQRIDEGFILDVLKDEIRMHGRLSVVTYLWSIRAAATRGNWEDGMDFAANVFSRFFPRSFANCDTTGAFCRKRD